MEYEVLRKKRVRVRRGWMLSRDLWCQRNGMARRGRRKKMGSYYKDFLWVPTIVVQGYLLVLIARSPASRCQAGCTCFKHFYGKSFILFILWWLCVPKLFFHLHMLHSDSWLSFYGVSHNLLPRYYMLYIQIFPSYNDGSHRGVGYTLLWTSYHLKMLCP